MRDQHVQFLVGLDPLGHDVEVESPGELGDGGEDGVLLL